MTSAAEFMIRRAGPKDAADVAAVLHESFVEFRSLYTVAGFAATALQADQVQQRMREGPVWVAIRNGVVLGTVAAVVKGNSAYMRGMAVLPVARGSGAGSALLQEVENWASAEGCSRVFLSTTPFLDSAVRLYERSGFRRMNEAPQDLFGTPLFTMEKRIPGKVTRPDFGPHFPATK